MANSSRHSRSEIKAGIWIFISLVVMTGFLVAVTGARFWKEYDHYRVRLDYIGGLEVGSPVRMGGVLVGKISSVEFVQSRNANIELTIEVPGDIKIKSNTVAFLSFISITSEQHLELEPSPEPAPMLQPGDLISSRELPTMDDVLADVGYIGDTLKVILHRVNVLLNPTNMSRIDSIITGVNGMVRLASADMEGLLTEARGTVVSLDSLVNRVDRMLAGSDSLVRYTVDDARRTIRQANETLAGIDTTVQGVDRWIRNNGGDLSAILHDMERTSENLKIMTDQIKDNPFLLIRAIPREERELK